LHHFGKRNHNKRLDKFYIYLTYFTEEGK